MGLWAPLAQLGHGAIGSLVGRLLTLDKAREGAPGLLVVLVVHMCIGNHLHRGHGVADGPAATLV